MNPFDNRPPLVEPSPIQDVFVTELAAIMRLGPNLRLTFSVPEIDIHDGRPERVVMVKLVIPAEAVPAMLATLSEGNCSPRRVWDGSWNGGAFGEWQAVEG
jgi:hypothetical protein